MSEPLRGIFSEAGLRGMRAEILRLQREGKLRVRTALRPDLLRYDQLGAAAGWRGRVVRAFFWCLRVWPPTGVI